MHALTSEDSTPTRQYPTCPSRSTTKHRYSTESGHISLPNTEQDIHGHWIEMHGMRPQGWGEPRKLFYFHLYLFFSLFSLFFLSFSLLLFFLTFGPAGPRRADVNLIACGKCRKISLSIHRSGRHPGWMLSGWCIGGSSMAFSSPSLLFSLPPPQLPSPPTAA